MIGLSKGHRRNMQESIEGYMGKVINVFDLSAGMAGNQLLTEKAHGDGSPVRRNWSDTVKKPIDPVRGHIDERLITINDVRKSSPSKKSSATPMKMLIAQELLKETEPKRKQPSIVARLMGLDDTIPVQQPVLTAKRNSNESYPRSKSAGASRGRRQPGDTKLERSMSHEIHSCSHEKEYKDVYVVCQQPSRINHSRDYAPQKERLTEIQATKRMALVRQKFMEAKRLATDEKLLHSKEFQDALEVLSSNRDLFLKFLEEPNSLFLKNAQELHSVSSPHQKKRITVLKPSNCVEPKGERRVAKPQYSPSIGNDQETNKSYRVSNSSYSKSDNLFQPTRIVVLKPSPTKYQDVNGTPTSTGSSPELPQHNDFYQRHRRDESLLMNGYIGDDSSVDKSDNEYIEEDVSNFSDSEIMSSVSRNSWDYNNRMGSLYSPSSFDQMAYSPESSVIREARKRLSERWASVASKGNNEDTQAWKSSSTLGEMLAIPEVKKKAINNRGFAASWEIQTKLGFHQYSEMGVFTFVCRSSGDEWSAKPLSGDIEASAASTYDLQRKLVQAALSKDSSGGVSSSFSLVTPSSAVFQVIIGGGGGGGFVGGGGASSGGAAAGSAGGAAVAEAPAVEEKKEEKEESDDDMGFSLFD